MVTRGQLPGRSKSETKVGGLTLTVTVTLALPLPLPLTLTLTLTNQVRHGELLAVLVHGEGDRAARLRRARRGGQPLLL